MEEIPAASPPLVNVSGDNNATSQANPGQGHCELRDAPLINSEGRGDQNCTDEGKIYVPRKYDVLLGRGRPLQDHPGNLRFHKIINRARTSYVNSRKEGKAGIAKEVLNEIQTSKKKSEMNSNQPHIGDGGGNGVSDEVNSPSSGGEPGRFLKKIGDANASGEDVYWLLVSQEVAIEKISHALRGRPRSETSNRNDGSGGSKGSGSNGLGKGQSGVTSGRRKPSKNIFSGDNTTSNGKSKRKEPPSPPTKEIAPNGAVGTNVSGFTNGVGTFIESGEETALQRSNITDAIFTTNANTPNRMPTLLKGSSMSTLPTSNINEPTKVNVNEDNNNTVSNPTGYGPLDNQLQSMLTAWHLQQFQAAMQFQQQNAQQVARQQLFQQFQQQQQIAATGGAGSGTTATFGQNQQPSMNTAGAGQLSTQQQQLQLLLQQHQAQRLLQQQAQQLQPQQVQYVLQQNHIQPQQPQQHQQQVQSTIQQPQQTQAQQQLEKYLQQQQQMALLASAQQRGQGGGNPLEHGKTQQSQHHQSQIHPSSYQQQHTHPTTASSSGIGIPVASNANGGGATTGLNLATAAAAILSATQHASGTVSANATITNQNNITEALLLGASAILAAQQAQSTPNQTSQNPQPVASQSGSGQIASTTGPRLQQQQSQELLLAALYPQQPLHQRPSSNPNSSSLPMSQQQPQQPPGKPPPPNNS